MTPTIQPGDALTLIGRGYSLREDRHVFQTREGDRILNWYVPLWKIRPDATDAEVIALLAGANQRTGDEPV